MPSGKRWNKSEDEILALGIEEGASYSEIGQVIDRSDKACALRAFTLRRRSDKNATRYWVGKGRKGANKATKVVVARNTTAGIPKLVFKTPASEAASEGGSSASSNATSPAPRPQPPSDGRYIPVVESGAVNASLNRLFMVSVASMLFSVSTFVLISVVLLAR